MSRQAVRAHRSPALYGQGGYQRGTQSHPEVVEVLPALYGQGGHHRDTQSDPAVEVLPALCGQGGDHRVAQSGPVVEVRRPFTGKAVIIGSPGQVRWFRCCRPFTGKAAPKANGSSGTSQGRGSDR